MSARDLKSTNGFLLSDFKYLMAYSIPLTALIGFYLGGYWLFTTPFYIFVIIPIVEFLLTRYGIDELETHRAEKGIHWLFDLMLYLNILIVFGLLIYSLTKIVSFEFISIEFLGSLLSFGLAMSNDFQSAYITRDWDTASKWVSAELGTTIYNSNGSALTVQSQEI